MRRVAFGLILLVIGGWVAGGGDHPGHHLRALAQAATTTGAWVEESPNTSPVGRDGPYLAFDAAHDVVVLHGGVNNAGVYMTDTWTWDGSNWTQHLPANSPPPRIIGTMVYDSVRNEMVLFGGCVASGCQFGHLQDTWTWDGSNWTEEQPLHRPPARRGAAMAFDEARGVVVLYGGTNGPYANFADTWIWDGSDWIEQHPLTSPGTRYLGAMAYHRPSASVVLFGGESGTPPTAEMVTDTWSWDGSDWRLNSQSNHPTGRYLPGLASDPVSGDLVLFGGMSRCCDRLGDTWTWDGTDWVAQAVSPSPVARAAPGMGLG